MPEPIVSLTGATKEYSTGAESVLALDDVSLALAPAEFVALVAPSGSGKSTLLHLIGLLDTPTRGSVRLGTDEVGTMSDAERSRMRLHHIGFVFQFFNLMPTLTAWENVALPRVMGGEKLKAAQPRALALLDRVGLSGRANHQPGELSGGQLQRVAIARSLVMDPKLLVADEPTGSLDSHTGEQIVDLLAEIAHDEGRAVIMATHDRDAAARASRTIRLLDGRIA